MKKNVRILSSLVLILVLCVSIVLASCGGDTSDNTTASTTTAEPTETTETTTEPGETDIDNDVTWPSDWE